MAKDLIAVCDLVNAVMKFNLPKDTIDVDLKVHTLRDIHTYKKDRDNLIKKFSSWSDKLILFPSFKRKVTQIVTREATTSNTNRLNVQP